MCTNNAKLQTTPNYTTYLNLSWHLRQRTQFQCRFAMVLGIAHNIVQVHVHCVVLAELGPEIGLPLTRRTPICKLVWPVVRFPATHTHTQNKISHTCKNFICCTKFLTHAKILYHAQNFSHMQKFYMMHKISHTCKNFIWYTKFLTHAKILYHTQNFSHPTWCWSTVAADLLRWSSGGGRNSDFHTSIVVLANRGL